MAYTAPAAGTVRGSARFGSIAQGLGARNNNAIDINEWGAGLWTAGFDPNRVNQGPQEQSAFIAQLNDYIAQNKINSGEFFAKNPGINPQSVTAPLEVVDWWVRDQSRAQDKSNNFLDTTLGKIITAGAQVALGAIPGIGPALSAGLGAYTGQRNGGGVFGGLLGAASGFGAGKLGSSLATNGIKGTFTNLVDSAKDFFGGGSNGTLTSINEFFPQDIAARSLTGAGVMGNAARLSGVMTAAGIPALGKASSLATAAGTASKAAGAAALLQSDTVKSALGLGVPLVAGLAVANSLKPSGALSPNPTSGATTNLGGAGDVQGSVPTSVGDPRFAEARKAQAASGASDTIATSAMGLTGDPRTRRKKVLGA